MKRIREILRNEYIGAIAIGFLLFQVFATLISTIMQPIAAYVENRGRPQSIFAQAHSIFNWPQIILNGISITLTLTLALLLLAWVYAKKAPPAEAAPAVPDSAASVEKAVSSDKLEEPS
jgi:hypothetical protein